LGYVPDQEFVYIHENRDDIFEGWVEDEFGQLIHAETGEVFKQEDEVAPEIALGGGQHGWHDALLNQGTPEVGNTDVEPETEPHTVEAGYTVEEFVSWHRE